MPEPARQTRSVPGGAPEEKRPEAARGVAANAWAHQLAGGKPAVSNRGLARALLARQDLLAGTHAPTQRQHADVEAVLHPGSRVVVTPPSSSSAAPTVTVEGPPAMTGAGPAARSRSRCSPRCARTCRVGERPAHAPGGGAAGVPDGPGQRHRPRRAGGGRAALRLVDPGRDAAGRRPLPPGRRSTSRACSATSPGARSTTAQRMGWTSYWMTLDGVGQQVLDTHHVLEDRDGAEFNRVLPAVRTRPGQPQRHRRRDPLLAGRGGDRHRLHPAVRRSGRRHPHDPLGPLHHADPRDDAQGRAPELRAHRAGDRRQRPEVHDRGLRRPHAPRPLGRGGRPAGAAGHARGRGAAAAGRGRDLPLRRVEDRLPPGLHEIAQARQIRRHVGMENCKAAFFLGHTELLGIGAGTGATTSLAGLAEWQTSDATDEQILHVAGRGHARARSRAAPACRSAHCGARTRATCLAAGDGARHERRPKHAEKVAFGSLMPISVPASFAV